MGGGVQSRNHAPSFSFSCNHAHIFPIFTQSRKLINFVHFHAIRHTFFPFSHNHQHNKRAFTPPRTQKIPFTHHARRSIHAIRQYFFHFHAITQQKRAIHTITQTYGGPSSKKVQRILFMIVFSGFEMCLANLYCIVLCCIVEISWPGSPP